MVSEKCLNETVVLVLVLLKPVLSRVRVKPETPLTASNYRASRHSTKESIDQRDRQASRQTILWGRAAGRWLPKEKLCSAIALASLERLVRQHAAARQPVRQPPTVGKELDASLFNCVLICSEWMFSAAVGLPTCSREHKNTSLEKGMLRTSLF